MPFHRGGVLAKLQEPLAGGFAKCYPTRDRVPFVATHIAAGGYEAGPAPRILDPQMQESRAVVAPEDGTETEAEICHNASRG